jgi:hypothetical protein
MRQDHSYPYVIGMPRNEEPRVRELRDAGKFTARIIIEDNGAPDLRIECESEEDRATLVLLRGY